MDVLNSQSDDRLATHFANPLLRWGAVGAIALIVVVLVGRSIYASRLKDQAGDGRTVPLVTVVSPGVTAAATTVAVTGTISARNEMPVGNEGDVARIAAVYVEAGDRVRRGQVLARLDTSVIGPQVGSLRASYEEAQAAAELAQADYHRAQAVAASGALSAEETERRRTAALSAAAKVKVAAAQLAEARARWGRTELRAPAAGIVLTRNAEIGQAASVPSVEGRRGRIARRRG
jgi:HlyD family secretion protein